VEMVRSSGVDGSDQRGRTRSCRHRRRPRPRYWCLAGCGHPRPGSTPESLPDPDQEGTGIADIAGRIIVTGARAATIPSGDRIDTVFSMPGAHADRRREWASAVHDRACGRADGGRGALHLCIQEGGADRNLTPFLDNLRKRAMHPTGTLDALHIARGRSDPQRWTARRRRFPASLRMADWLRDLAAQVERAAGDGLIAEMPRGDVPQPLDEGDCLRVPSLGDLGLSWCRQEVRMAATGRARQRSEGVLLSFADGFSRGHSERAAQSAPGDVSGVRPAFPHRVRCPDRNGQHPRGQERSICRGWASGPRR